MKKLTIVGNFKSHKTRFDIQNWIEKFKIGFNDQFLLDTKHIVIAPPLPSLQLFSERLLSSLPGLSLGVQDISPFSAGAYTGAVCGENLEGYDVSFAIIGHSERRTYFFESDEVLGKKVTEAKKYNIEPIYCVQGLETVIPEGVSIVAYEPVFAIGSGHPDTPENADTVAKQIKQAQGVTAVLYGGSVTADNVHRFTSMEHLDGVLVGGASLDSDQFLKIIVNS